MKTHPFTRLLGIVFTVVLASCGNKPATTRIPVSATSHASTPVSNQLLQAINSYRRSLGKMELQRHQGLDRLAQQHSEYLRQHRGTFTLHGKNISHIGFESRAMFARERYQMVNISENVASAFHHKGKNQTSTLLGLWKDSKDHHKNMIDDWTHTGIGVVVDSDGTAFATQLFSTISYSQMSMRDKFNRH